MTDNPYEPPSEPTWSEPELTDEQRRGQRILLVHIALLLAISLAVIVTYMLKIGPRHLPGQTFRFVLNVVLYWAAYRGSVAGVRIAIFLCGSAGVLGVIAVVRGGASLGLFGLSISSAMALVNLSFAFMLLASPSVEAYFNYRYLQKQESR